MAISDQLDLDIRAALREIDRLERAIDQSIQAGARAGGQKVVAELRRGEEVHLNLPAPTIDTHTIPAQIETAAETATPTVNVDANAASVTPTIDSAVAAADSEVDVTARVEGTDDLSRAADEAGRLDENVQATTESSSHLASTLQVVAAAVVAGGIVNFFKGAVTAASDLGEAINKVQVVFGSAADTVLAFGRNSAESLGLANTAALDLAGQFGILFEAAGVNADQAAQLSVNLLQLSGDIASLQNVQGGAAGAAEALGAALRGETDPARALGIILNDQSVQAAAVQQGLAGVGEELTSQQRVLATYSELMRQGGVASGDFQNTITSIPNQLRLLGAEFTDTQGRIGSLLLPTVQQLIGVIRTDLLPSFEQLATSAVPAVAAVLEALVPVIQVIASVLVAIAPAVEAFALGLQRVGPVASLVAVGLLLIGTNLKALTVAAEEFQLTGIGATIAALGAAVTIAAVAFGRSSQQAAEHARAVEALRSEVFATSTAIEDLSGSLETYITESKNSAFATDDLTAALASLGDNVGSQIASDLTQGTEGLQAFLAQLQAAGQIDAGANIADLTAKLSDLNPIVVSSDKALLGLSDSATELINAYLTTASTADDAAEAQANLLVVNGQATQASRDLAVQLETTSDGTTNWVAVLQRLGNQQRANEAATDRLTAAALRYQQSLGRVAPLTSDEAQAIHDLRGELDPANQAVSLTADQLERFTNVLQNGAVSAQEFAQIASDFGVSVEDLAAAEQTVTDNLAQSLADQQASIDSWAQTLSQTAPSASQAFQEAQNDLIPGADIHNALVSFQDDANAFALAQATLASLTERGFSGLATFLATQPPAIINQAAFQTDEALSGLETMVDDANTTLEGASTDMTTNAASLATGVTGGFQDAAAGVGEADLPGAVGGAVGDAADVLATEGQQSDQSRVYSSAKKVGNAAGHGLIVGVNELRPDIIAAYKRIGADAVQAIRDGAGVHSPSKFTIEAGRNLSKGLLLGALAEFEADDFGTIGAQAAAALAAGATTSAQVAAGAAVASASVASVPQAQGQTVTLDRQSPVELTAFVDVNLDGQPVREMAQATVTTNNRQLVQAVRGRPRGG